MTSHSSGRTLLTLSAVPSHNLDALGSLPDRRQKLVTLPDGRIVDENAMRDYLAALDRRNERITVLRLSENDAACQAMAKVGR